MQRPLLLRPKIVKYNQQQLRRFSSNAKWLTTLRKHQDFKMPSSRRKKSNASRSTRWINSVILSISIVLFIATLFTRGKGLDTLSQLPDLTLTSFSFTPANDSLIEEANNHNDHSKNTVSREKREDKGLPDNGFKSRGLDKRGVDEHLTTIRQDWAGVIDSFLDGTSASDFSARNIREHYEANVNNVHDTCILVQILEGNVTFTEKYHGKRHGRASSAKYIIKKLVRQKGGSMPGATFLVMVTDGHKPKVASFGSARHWKNWKLMIPVPLGNERGVREGWGTPLEGWDAYIDRTVLSTHQNYAWESKREKALFRGALAMQTYKLGTCNSENDARCERAKKWNEINRGVLYEKTKKRTDLVDIGFTSLKQKENGDNKQFEGAPEVKESMKFTEYQNYKYVLNVGSNQDWAERLRSLLFLNSAVIHHVAESQEFFTPLMRPWVHFIPTNIYFDDLIENIEWAKKNDDFIRQLVRNQNAFADRYISERSMQQYWEVAIEKFAALQAQAAGET
ncbi:unnamed protein product [Agarophyton chilense]|eukprot:gb/GEZJ01002553.1/.p1 GENE.gb/GEZJ01002553.1/~~gb/GEZJ01002553.1/.p1  ORF type:complete len:509 (-),score=79.67 gb/GEZJ01002553.1/:4482-6008(-)